MPTVKADGADIYYEIHGSGPPLLLAAGLGGAGTYWREQVPAFAAKFTTVVYDQRGTGRSSHVPVKSIEQLADDTIRLLDALGLERVDYLGHSTGGAIGQVLAVENPERIGRLILYATVASNDAYRERLWGLRRKVLETMGPEHYARMTSLVLYAPQWIAENSERLKKEEEVSASMLSKPEIMASRIASILAFDRARDLGRIDRPTLVLCARDDITTPAYFSEQIAAAIPGAKLTVLDFGGHGCSKTVPEEFNKIVLEFLAA